VPAPQHLYRRLYELSALIDAPEPLPPRLHPNLPELYRRKVEDLANTLNADGSKA